MDDTQNFEPLSQTSYYLESCCNGKSLANGTCFFIFKNDKCYLITNWHIVTGQNPKTKEFLGYYAVNPDTIKIKIYKNQDMLELTELEIKLNDENGNNVWLEHPIYKENVDVIAIPVDIPVDKLVLSPETFIEPFNEETRVKVRDEVYILGFPFGLSSGDIFPIWKRGSIATEPIVDVDGLPKTFIDTATRSGMSGSPVIYIEKRAVGIGDAPPGTPNAKFSSKHMQIVGIYSGRIGADDELKAQLGIVWKFKIVNEIIQQ